MAFQRRAVVGWLVLGCVQAIVICWILFRQNIPVSPASSNVNPQKRGSVDGGDPHQRERIDKFIENVRRMNCDECVVALNHRSSSVGPDLILLAGLDSSSPVPTLSFVQVLSDRRVAKIYSSLESMKPIAAEEKAVAIFDDKLQVASSLWAWSISQIHELNGKSDDVKGPYHEAKAPSVEMRSFDRANHALNAALFLCAAFASTETCHDKIAAWKESLGVFESHLQSDPSLGPLAFYSNMLRGPDALFVVNICAMQLDRRGHADRVDQIVDANLDMAPRFAVDEFLPWDAETLESDFTHRHLGVAVDNDDVLARFRVARQWPRRVESDASAQMGVAALFMEACHASSLHK